LEVVDVFSHAAATMSRSIVAIKRAEVFMPVDSRPPKLPAAGKCGDTRAPRRTEAMEGCMLRWIVRLLVLKFGAKLVDRYLRRPGSTTPRRRTVRR
jgi:hypothetical protein